MDKFTPGPWRVDDAKMQCNIFGANGRWVAELQDYAPSEVHRDWLWEDACLIAAAPELLEALRELLIAVTYADPPKNYGTHDDPNFGHEARVPTAFVDIARAAIAKATGDTV